MKYALLFLLSIVALSVATLVTFRRLATPQVNPVVAVAQPTADTLPTVEIDTPPIPTAADYARFAATDRVWRQHFAKSYSIADLRAIDPNRRNPRDEIRDRIFTLVRSNQRTRAISELERWVKAHPKDRDMLLSLARLLSEDGRSDDAVDRYRQVLSLHRGED